MSFFEKTSPDEVASSGLSWIVTLIFGSAIGGTLLDTVVKRAGKTSLQDLIPDVIKKIPIIGPVISWIAGIFNWGSDKLNSGIDYALNAIGIKPDGTSKPETQSPSKQPATASQPSVEVPQVPNKNHAPAKGK